MTDRPSLDSIFWSADETVRQLDALNRNEQARKSKNLADLQAIVGRLDFGSPAETEEPIGRRDRPDDVRRRPDEPEEYPYVAMPQHKNIADGGPVGPKVRAILIERAMAKAKDKW